MKHYIALIVFTLILLGGCATVTVLTGVGNGVVSEEADKGVVIKPKKSTGSENP